MGPGAHPIWALGPMEAEGRLFGAVWGGGATPLQRGVCGGRQPSHTKAVSAAIGNSEIPNPDVRKREGSKN